MEGFLIRSKRFQIGAEITNLGKRDFKSGQGLQIGAEQVTVNWEKPPSIFLNKYYCSE